VTHGWESDPDAEVTPQAGGAAAPEQRWDWFSRLILWLAAVVLGVSLIVIAAAYLPAWWADRVAGVVAGNRTAGVLGGFAVGLACTALPLIMLRSAVRPGLRWAERLLRLVVAVLLAVPNLLTLGVVIRGGSPGALARAVLDAHGQGFRGATLLGVVLGAVFVVAAWVLLAGRRRGLHELDDLRTRLELHDTRAADTRAADPSAADTPAADTPAADTPAADTPAADTRAADTPAEPRGERGTAPRPNLRDDQLDT
jgi:hypothetical protein